MPLTKPETISRNIRAEMARAGVTQAQLAVAIALSQSAISRRLSGEADWTVIELYAVAEALGCDPHALLSGVAA